MVTNGQDTASAVSTRSPGLQITYLYWQRQPNVLRERVELANTTAEERDLRAVSVVHNSHMLRVAVLAYDALRLL